MENRSLLESGISVSLINKEARKEKLAVPPINKMHYYYTRKPLISSRLVIAGALLDDDSVFNEREFNRLFGLDPSLKERAYKTIPANLLKKIKNKYPDGVTILDPFAGSGMIPFEGMRLGLNIVALDYNPIACLIMKCTLEYPVTYGAILEDGESKLYRDVKKYAELIFNKLKSELSQFYPTHKGIKSRAYIHAWVVICPVCGKLTPLVNNWILYTKNRTSLKYELINDELVYSIVENKTPQEGNIKRGKATCLYCASSISNNDIVNDISKNEREILLAVYMDNRKFELPTSEDIMAIENAKTYLKNNTSKLSKFIPIEKINNESPTKKYLEFWYRLFTPRQLIVLATMCKEINNIVKVLSKEDKEYASAVGSYLSMILSKHVAYNSRCTYWHNSFKKIGQTLAVRRPSMMWNHAEPNPFVKFSGSIIGGINDVLKGLKFAISELNTPSFEKKEKLNVEIYNQSILSWETDRKFKFIITDPPYYNDVQYPELMQFFQVWHSRTVGDLLGISPIPSTNEELSVGRNRSEEMFENRMLIAINRLHNLLHDDGVLVMFYVHKSIEGWKYVIEALRKTGFIVTSTISLMTESEGNVLAKGKSSIFHSLLITARKRTEDRKASILDIEDEIRNKIEERYPDLERIYGKDRTNLIVAASGIVIEIITQYSEVTSFTRNTVDYALEMGQKYLIEMFARQNLKIDKIDPTTMVYTWLRHSLTDDNDYSEFNLMLKALGISEDAISDIIHKSGGKRDRVRLRDFSERGSLEIDGIDPLIEESLIDAVHIALRSYVDAQGGITAAKEKIERSVYGRDDIIHTIESLSKLKFTKTAYSEGAVCAKFMEDWDALHAAPQPRTLIDWTERREKKS